MKKTLMFAKIKLKKLYYNLGYADISFTQICFKLSPKYKFGSLEMSSKSWNASHEMQAIWKNVFSDQKIQHQKRAAHYRYLLSYDFHQNHSFGNLMVKEKHYRIYHLSLPLVIVSKVIK